MSKKDIFTRREQIRPFQYPQLEEFPQAIFRSFWEPNHFTYDKDIRDFNGRLNDTQRLILERTFLSIAVVENKVKAFWSSIGDRMPHTEVSDTGHVFGGNEVVHRLTYEKLLILMNLEDRFSDVLDVPCMRDRSAYLRKYLKGVKSRSNKEFTKSLILFTLLIENTSLFSQFLIASSFDNSRGLLKNFNTVITATCKEENLHARFGAELINIIREENPDWFDDEMEQKIRRNVRKAYKAELGVLDWIFEKGELEWISKAEVVEYLKHRFNVGLNLIGYDDEYKTDPELLKASDYMDVMLLSTKNFDQFDRKGVDYNVGKSFDEDELWN